jgi:NAD(P)-dependent dehydrogenase (short-subunit alcohol dehydrogenase family)
MVWSYADLPDLSERIVLVTGANTGIGYEVCKDLLQHTKVI